MVGGGLPFALLTAPRAARPPSHSRCSFGSNHRRHKSADFPPRRVRLWRNSLPRFPPRADKGHFGTLPRHGVMQSYGCNCSRNQSLPVPDLRKSSRSLASLYDSKYCTNTRSSGLRFLVRETRPARWSLSRSCRFRADPL